MAPTEPRSTDGPGSRLPILGSPTSGSPIATLALPAALLAAAALAPTPADAQSDTTTPEEATADPSVWPSPQWPLERDETQERRIDELLGQMTTEEKVGQILQGDISTVTPDDVRDYHLGSVLSGGNSGPYGDDKAPMERWLELADELHAASIDDADGGAAIPLVWGTDAVHGHSNIIGATLFPHNIGLGAMRDPVLIERIGEVTALEIRATGQEWTFAPTVTVPQDFRWGRAYEGYSSDPSLVSEYVGRLVTGLQGEPGATPILDGPHVIASTKHFIADGGTENGTDQGDARIDETELRDVHGAPYVPAVESGVATVMASFSSWNGVKVTGNKSLLTGVLKERMNFDGLLVSDWNAHGQIQGCTNESCPEALLAGIDMYMAPDTWKPLYESLNAQIAAGEVPMERLDDAVRRILRVKMRLGLFEAGKPSERPHAGDWSLVGAEEHRAVAREAVRKSLVLLKNRSGLLPLVPRHEAPGRGRRRRRHRSPVRRLDDHLAGHRRRQRRLPRRDIAVAGPVDGGHRERRRGRARLRRRVRDPAGRGRRGLRGDAVRRVPGRPSLLAAIPRLPPTLRDDAAAKGAGHPGDRPDDHRPPAVREPRAQRRRRLRRRLAAGLGGGGRGRPPRRRSRRGTPLRLHRQAPRGLARQRPSGGRALRLRSRALASTTRRRSGPRSTRTSERPGRASRSGSTRASRPRRGRSRSAARTATSPVSRACRPRRPAARSRSARPTSACRRAPASSSSPTGRRPSRCRCSRPWTSGRPAGTGTCSPS